VDSSILSLVWVIPREKKETKKETLYTKSLIGRENYKSYSSIRQIAHIEGILCFLTDIKLNFETEIELIPNKSSYNLK